MKIFEANFGTIVLRYYLLMAVIIAAFFSGFYWLAILAVPIFLSALMGAKFEVTKKAKSYQSHAMDSKSKLQHAA